MTVNTNDIIRASAQARFDSALAVQSVFHFRHTGSPTDDADVVDDIRDIIQAAYALLQEVLTSAWEWEQIRVVNLTQAADIGTGIPTDLTPVDTVTGTDPPQVAAIVTFDTARLNAVGRKFIGPIPTAAAGDQGDLTAGVIADLADFADALVGALSPTNSTYECGILSTIDEVFLPFIGFAVSTIAGTQRRRRKGVGI